MNKWPVSCAKKCPVTLESPRKETFGAIVAVPNLSWKVLNRLLPLSTFAKPIPSNFLSHGRNGELLSYISSSLSRIQGFCTNKRGFDWLFRNGSNYCR